MKALVIYDSFFGNTERIAQAIRDGLETQLETEILKADAVSSGDMATADLLVIGSPTRGFRPTEAIVKLLETLSEDSLRGTRAAAFDTRYKADELESSALRFIVQTGGYAAKRIDSRLRKVGASQAAPPEGFFVEDMEGPLKSGELERAQAWASRLIREA